MIIIKSAKSNAIFVGRSNKMETRNNTSSRQENKENKKKGKETERVRCEHTGIGVTIS